MAATGEQKAEINARPHNRAKRRRYNKTETGQRAQDTAKNNYEGAHPDRAKAQKRNENRDPASTHKCARCGKTAIHIHHVSYHPEKVEYLCHDHHISAHHGKRYHVTEKAHKDQIPGGLADKKEPKDFDPKALAAGVKVEREHTSDHGIAVEIAMDHLTEDPKYYEKLKQVEKSHHGAENVARLALVSDFENPAWTEQFSGTEIYDRALQFLAEYLSESAEIEEEHAKLRPDYDAYNEGYSKLHAIREKFEAQAKKLVAELFETRAKNLYRSNKMNPVFKEIMDRKTAKAMGFNQGETESEEADAKKEGDADDMDAKSMDADKDDEGGDKDKKNPFAGGKNPFVKKGESVAADRSGGAKTDGSSPIGESVGKSDMAPAQPRSSDFEAQSGMPQPSDEDIGRAYAMAIGDYGNNGFENTEPTSQPIAQGTHGGSAELASNVEQKFTEDAPSGKIAKGGPVMWFGRQPLSTTEDEYITNALNKSRSGHYVEVEPITGNPAAMINKSRKCGCGTPFPAFLTVCPTCGADHSQRLY